MAYTIVRKSYGYNDHVYLGKEDDSFIFDSKKEAEECLKLLFNNGEWMQDERYGEVRYYVATFDLESLQRKNAMIQACLEMGAD